MAHDPDDARDADREYEYDHDHGHEHDLEAEYLSANDATPVEIYAENGSVLVDLLVPCPTCSDPLRLSARVTEITEADVDLPLEDEADPYD